MKRRSFLLFVALPLLVVAGVIANKVRLSWQTEQAVNVKAPGNNEPGTSSSALATQPAAGQSTTAASQSAKMPVDNVARASTKDAPQSPASAEPPATTSASLADGAPLKDAAAPAAATPVQTAQPSTTDHALAQPVKPALPSSQAEDPPETNPANLDDEKPSSLPSQPAMALQQQATPALGRTDRPGSNEQPVLSVRAPAQEVSKPSPASAAPTSSAPGEGTTVPKVPAKMLNPALEQSALARAPSPSEQSPSSPLSSTVQPKTVNRPTGTRLARSKPATGSNDRSSQYRPLAIAPAPQPVLRPEPYARPAARAIYQGQP